MLDYSRKRSVAKVTEKGRKRSAKTTGRNIAKRAAEQKAQAAILEGGRQVFKYAAKSQMKGQIGVALRVSGRVGLRVVPFVGAAMLAYDLYKLGEYILD